MIPPLHMSLLGDFLLMSGEPPVATATLPRAQPLITYLVLHQRAPQDRFHLPFSRGQPYTVSRDSREPVLRDRNGALAHLNRQASYSVLAARR